MNLVETLTAETQTLKAQYLDMTATWAGSEFGRFEELAATPHPTYGEFASEGWTKHKNGWDINPQGNMAIDYAQGKKYNKAVDRRYAAQQIVEKGLEAYVEKMKALATRHYEDSIIKLAARIQVKGLNEATLTVKTAHVGVNIDTVLTDGEKTVRAFTIIASGPIQKPHYRYLIK